MIYNKTKKSHVVSPHEWYRNSMKNIVSPQNGDTIVETYLPQFSHKSVQIGTKWCRTVIRTRKKHVWRYDILEIRYFNSEATIYKCHSWLKWALWCIFSPKSPQGDAKKIFSRVNVTCFIKRTYVSTFWPTFRKIEWIIKSYYPKSVIFGHFVGILGVLTPLYPLGP